MSRTEGEGLGQWITDSVEEPGHPVLDPAIVEAIATIPLGRLKPYDMDYFIAYLRYTRPETAPASRTPQLYELTMPCAKA
jgi:hypothetical protein